MDEEVGGRRGRREFVNGVFVCTRPTVTSLIPIRVIAIRLIPAGTFAIDILALEEVPLVFGGGADFSATTSPGRRGLRRAGSIVQL